ncbi:ABC transporter permease [Sutterella sp.]|uniref:ABC transporter permease n=1 Tax=Sutterella sp. TaxID=1981025 RepID=UPI003FD8DA77
MPSSASRLTRLSALVALAALLFFILLPLAGIFTTALSGEGGWSLDHALKALAADDNLETVVNSVVLAGLVVLVTTVFATPLALLLARTHWAESKWLDVALLIPFMTPPYIGAMGWILFMQKRGLLEQMVPGVAPYTSAFFSLGGLVFVMSLHALPFMVTMMKNALLRVPGNLEEAGAVAGAGFLMRMRRILLPLVTGNYAIAMLLVFVKTLAEYGTPSTLGRRIGFDVFTTKIHAYATTAPVDFASAATLSLVLITICMVMWMLQSSITASRSFRLVGAKGSRAAKWRLSTWARRAAGGYIAFVLFLSILVPWFSVLATSLIKIRGYGLAWGNFTVNHYVELFSEDVEGLSAFTTSLGLALAAGLIASVLGTAVVLLVRRSGRVGRFVEGTALIPEMLPSIVLAIGLMLFWNRIYAYAPLYNTIGFMVLVYVILYLPYSIQYVSSAWMQMSPSLEEAGRVAGGSPAFVFRRVTLPLIAAGVIQGFIMIFIIVLRELVAASLISPPDVLVISTFIVNEFEQGSASVAMAAAFLCVAISAFMLYLLRVLLARVKGAGAF